MPNLTTILGGMSTARTSGNSVISPSFNGARSAITNSVLRQHVPSNSRSQAILIKSEEAYDEVIECSAKIKYLEQRLNTLGNAPKKTDWQGQLKKMRKDLDKYRHRARNTVVNPHREDSRQQKLISDLQQLSKDLTQLQEQAGCMSDIPSEAITGSSKLVYSLITKCMDHIKELEKNRDTLEGQEKEDWTIVIDHQITRLEDYMEEALTAFIGKSPKDKEQKAITTRLAVFESSLSNLKNDFPRLPNLSQPLKHTGPESSTVVARLDECAKKLVSIKEKLNKLPNGEYKEDLKIEFEKHLERFTELQFELFDAINQRPSEQLTTVNQDLAYFLTGLSDFSSSLSNALELTKNS